MKDYTTTHTALITIREGMTVYDSEGEKLGDIEFIRFGDEILNNADIETREAEGAEGGKMIAVPAAGVTGVAGATTGTGAGYPAGSYPVFPVILEDFPGINELPEEMRERLSRYGYLKIDTSILADDYYVLLYEVAEVTEDSVKLGIPKEDVPEY